MDVSRRYLVTAAVLFGALVFFVPLTYAIVQNAITTLTDLAVGLPSGPFQLAIHVFALVVGFVTAVEIARVRLHGFTELHRGTRRRRLGRHAILAVVVLSVLVSVLGLLASAMRWSLANDSLGVHGLVAVNVVTLVWVLYRAGGMLVSGYRRPT